MPTTILSHSDADGICSAALLLARFPKASVFFTKPVSLYRDLRGTKADKIIIADIAITKRDAEKIADLIKQKKDVLYFDHHAVPEGAGEIPCEFVHNLKQSTSELVYRHFKKEPPKERAWLAIYGAIADYFATRFVKERLKNWDVRALYFEVSTLVLGIKSERFSRYGEKRKIVKLLSLGKNPSDVPGLVESAKLAVTREFELYEIIKKSANKLGSVGYVEKIPNFGFRGPSALFAATVTDSPVGICVHYRENHTDITIRGRDRLPLNKLAEEAAESVGGSGGGHPEAAGARIPGRTLNKFLKRMNELIGEYGK